MSNLYDLTQTEEGYQFVTDSGIAYQLYFTEYYLKDGDGDDLIVQSFGFFPSPEIKRGKGAVNKYDEKVKKTILAFITGYFEKNKEIGLLYICDQADGYARHRRIAFSRWHKEIDISIEKFDCKESHAKAGFYASLLVRSDNPRKAYYVEAFYRSLAEYFPED
ncbi:MAG: DUF6169 family protein [Chitinophaga sp.]